MKLSVVILGCLLGLAAANEIAFDDDFDTTNVMESFSPLNWIKHIKNPFGLGSSNQPESEVISGLVKKILSLQYKSERTTRFGPFAEVEGGFPSSGHLYCHGNVICDFVRNVPHASDNNGFVTAWTLDLLLEGGRYGHIPSLTEEKSSSLDEMSRSFLAVEQFHDKNDVNRSITSTFWRQSYNETSKLWYQSPRNFNLIFQTLYKLIPFKTLNKIADATHNDKLKQLIPAIESQMKSGTRLLRIPADTDDSSVVLSLATKLASQDDWIPLANSAYAEKFVQRVGINGSKNSRNVDAIKAYAEAVVKYAYEPASSSVDKNVIDPRTYYWIHDILAEWKNASYGAPALVNTWMLNQTENHQTVDGGIQMPLNTNNVDLAVLANTLSAFTEAAFELGTEGWWSNDLGRVYVNSTRLISDVLRLGKL